jgi:hypothetical protein
MTSRLFRCVSLAAITLAYAGLPALAGEPKITEVDWENACGGSNIRVTRVDGAIVAIDASVEHYYEARQWECHFVRGQIISALYRHSKVKRKATAQEDAFTTELQDDLVTTFQFPNHKLTGMPQELLEDLQAVLAKATR